MKKFSFYLCLLGIAMVAMPLQADAQNRAASGASGVTELNRQIDMLESLLREGEDIADCGQANPTSQYYGGEGAGSCIEPKNVNIEFKRDADRGIIEISVQEIDGEQGPWIPVKGERGDEGDVIIEDGGGTTVSKGDWTLGSWSSCQGASATWQTGAWNECSATCGGGQQSRSVTCNKSAGTQTASYTCNNSEGCDGSKPSPETRSCDVACSNSNKPSTTQNCATNMCPPEQTTGVWKMNSMEDCNRDFLRGGHNCANVKNGTSGSAYDNFPRCVSSPEGKTCIIGQRNCITFSGAWLRTYACREGSTTPPPGNGGGGGTPNPPPGGGGGGGGGGRPPGGPIMIH